jgi:hypothetical protein
MEKKKNWIVHHSDSYRMNLMQQLATINSDPTVSMKDFEEASRRLTTIHTLDGIVFVPVLEDLKPLVAFMRLLRAMTQTTSVIALTESLSLDILRTVIDCGVDQVLVYGFSLNQLKEKIAAAEKFRQQVFEENESNQKAESFSTQFEEISPSFYKISLHGHLAEISPLPKLTPSDKDGATLFIDCERLTGINSVGIRSWMLWFRDLSLQGFSKFEFENLHTPILQQTGLVNGFIPANGTINSFYLYYWDESTNDEEEFKFSLSPEANQLVLPRQKVVEKDGKKIIFRLDESSKKILKFYKGQIVFSD